MMFVNVPPIGCTPELLTILPLGSPEVYDAFGCHIPFDSVLRAHNTQMRAGLLELRRRLPQAKFTYVDYYNATYNITRHGERYGFVNYTHSCCGWGGHWNYDQKVGCSSSTIIDGVQVSAGSCPNPNVFINWDGIHPTEAFAKVAARAILEGTYI